MRRGDGTSYMLGLYWWEPGGIVSGWTLFGAKSTSENRFHCLSLGDISTYDNSHNSVSSYMTIDHCARERGGTDTPHPRPHSPF